MCELKKKEKEKYENFKTTKLENKNFRKARVHNMAICYTYFLIK